MLLDFEEFQGACTAVLSKYVNRFYKNDTKRNFAVTLMSSGYCGQTILDFACSKLSICAINLSAFLILFENL